MAIIVEHQGRRPRVHDSAYIAPNAVLCGDVAVGANTCVLFGAVVTAEGGPVELGSDCVVMENAVLRGTQRHPLRIDNHVLVGPCAHLSGCTVEANVFVGTGAAVFNGARLGTGSEVRIHGVVHINSLLPPYTIVPIGWVAVGDPAHVLPPGEHEVIWAVQSALNFPQTVFGLGSAPEGESIMPELTRRYTRALLRHQQDRQL
jgi:carbonic anhydrase/acetyltransferase-like protein (isoleucine patch superfamily)